MIEAEVSDLEEILNNSAFKSSVKYRKHVYAPNEKILERNKKNEFIFFIRKGAVRIVLENDNKEQSVLVHPGVCELGPGEIIGVFALFDELPTSADVVAVKESELIIMKISTLQNFLKRNHEIGFLILLLIIKSLIKHLRHADKTIANLYSWALKAHHIDNLLK